MIVQQAEKYDIICTLINLFSNQELAQKIKGYQEQIASLNSKCKMLTVKAKHATMLLTVRDAEGLTEEAQELDRAAKTQSQSSMVMVSPFVLTVLWETYTLQRINGTVQVYLLSLIIFTLGGVR